MGTTLVGLWLAAAVAAAQQGGGAYPPQLDGARVETYKTVNGVKMNLYIFTPAAHKPSDKRAAVVFFFGGGWNNGNPKQFEQQSRHLASRGMVAITADYRVASRHGVKAVDCVRDAKSAIRWVRQNAARLGIDPRRIAAGGGSAGGHLAAATGVIADLDESSEDLKVSSRPNALVLFNPALVLAGVARETRGIDLSERAGIDPVRISPLQHVEKGAPPTIIFHGKADTTVPYVTAEMFAKKMAAVASRCELVGFEGQTHGFFNYGRDQNKMYEATLQKADEFLVSLGYLPPP